VRGSADGVPPAYTLSLISGLIESEDSTTVKNELKQYVRDGGLERDANSVTHGDIAAKLKIKATSPEGLAAIGATFGGVATVGAYLSGGPIGAAIASGTIPFATTEFLNYFSMNPFRTKAELEATGQYAPDRKMQFDQSYNSVRDQLDYLTFNTEKLSPSERSAPYR